MELKEGEEEKKLVYFWPEDAETDNKLRKLGLVEGVVNFACRYFKVLLYLFPVLSTK